MTARVLVVDDIAVNVKLLEARLTVEYFEVVTASNGPTRSRSAERADATSFSST
jgi:two-component system cell cycle response regulator